MEDDNLDFLDGETPAEPTAAAQTAEQPASEPGAEPTSGPQRGPDGKFISKQAAEPAQATAPEPAAQPAPTPEAAQPVAQPEPAKIPEGYVPVGVVQALRDELNQFKQQARQAPQQPAPDPYEDFEAYSEWQQAQQTQERAEWSRQLAEARHGAETVAQAQQWAAERFAQDPVFAQQALSQRDPYGFAIDAWKRDQVLSKLSDPKLLETFLALASGQVPQAAPAAAPAAQPSIPTPPRSLASAPNAGGGKPGAVHMDDDAVFASTIR